jgi:hypothetical protein
MRFGRSRIETGTAGFFSYNLSSPQILLLLYPK